MIITLNILVLPGIHSTEHHSLRQDVQMMQACWYLQEGPAQLDKNKKGIETYAGKSFLTYITLPTITSVVPVQPLSSSSIRCMTGKHWFPTDNSPDKPLQILAKDAFCPLPPPTPPKMLDVFEEHPGFPLTCSRTHNACSLVGSTSGRQRTRL